MFINSLEKICNFLNTSIEELPFNLYTNEFSLPLSFYFDETSTDLIVFTTVDDGREKLVCVPKSEICGFEIVYQDDIDALMVEDPEKYRGIDLYE